MNFFEYFIRYTLVRNLNRLFKPKTLLIIVIVLLVLFFFLKSESQAIYIGNDDYTDPYNSIFLAYNSLGNDLLYRLDNLENSNVYNYDNLIGLLKNSDFGYYIYYGQNDGLNMINSNTYVQDDIWVCFYYLGNPSTSIATAYSNYQGLECSIIINRAVNYCYRISSSSIDVFTDIEVYMPSVLYNYRLDSVTSYLFNKSQTQNQELIDSINQQTNIIEQQNEYLQEEPSSNNFSTSDLPTGTGVSDITSNGFNNIFTLFYDTFTREPSSNDTIEIPIPFTSKKIILPYNYTQNFVPTALKSIINMFWYFVGSVYIVKDLLSKIEKIQTGDIENVANENIKGDLL